MPLHPNQKRSPLPYPFILEALAPLHPEVRPMFGGHSIYIGDKVVFMLRDRPSTPADNGLWLIFTNQEDAELPTPTHPNPLRSQFPSLRPIQLLEGKIKHWLLLPADSEDFESEALKACDLALAHNPHLGRIPKSRRTPLKQSGKQ